MKIERRITADYSESVRDKQQGEEASQQFVGEIGHVPFPILLFFPSFFISISFSLSLPPLFIFSFYFRTLPVSRDAYTNFSSLSLSRLSFSLLLLFFPRTPVSLLLPSHSLFGREHRRSGRCSFFLQTRERKLADLRAPSTHARSEAYRPEMLTLCRLRPKLLLATVSSRTLYRIIFTNHLER